MAFLQAWQTSRAVKQAVLAGQQNLEDQQCCQARRAGRTAGLAGQQGFQTNKAGRPLVMALNPVWQTRSQGQQCWQTVET